MDDIKKYEDPAFCLVSFNRISVSNEGMRLFGSSVKHNQVVALRISKAYQIRQLSYNSFYDDGLPYIEVFLSANQFAELLTTMNYGSGTPGTVHFKDGKLYKEPVVPSQTEQFNSELKDRAEDIAADLKSLINDLEEVEGQMSAKSRKEFLKRLLKIQMNLGPNLTYLMNQFVKQMNKVVVESKAEVEAFVDYTVKETGLKELKKNIPQQIE